jgi:hypothetical protein
MAEERTQPPERPQPDAAQLQQGADIAVAGQQAAAAEPDPARRRDAAARAMRQQAQKVRIELDEEQARMIAGYLVDEMEARGAFDPPPEPVAPPPGAPAAGQAASAPAAADMPAEPVKRTWAERFRSS